MAQLKPICVKCQQFYHPKKTGISFIEGMPIESRAPSGTERPDLWKPYKLWRGDLYECEGCHHQIISGFAQTPVSEHYMPDFQEQVQKFNATLQINDC